MQEVTNQVEMNGLFFYSRIDSIKVVRSSTRLYSFALTVDSPSSASRILTIGRIGRLLFWSTTIPVSPVFNLTVHPVGYAATCPDEYNLAELKVPGLSYLSL
ncbi:hypothetical protein DSY0842 [Desulfitobacterium hafniense Y51]|uniref:Uncharacterized protein n=1 Tax=Desulfitobacterium hafniense (strain Y51) TaxID=138119 RepID=Q24ZB1_DESHY|nr:hypothetical protein DSY0842 [Desulfitobacterium hafniense Y51]